MKKGSRKKKLENFWNKILHNLNLTSMHITNFFLRAINYAASHDTINLELSNLIFLSLSFLLTRFHKSKQNIFFSESVDKKQRAYDNGWYVSQ
jgi:hypothetical protein